MSDLPADLLYTKTHEWVKKNSDNTLTVGITAHATELLGELVFVELPEVSRNVHPGEEVAVVESVKAASDVYSPVAGEIVAINGDLDSAPEKVNASPYDQGWLFQLKPEMEDLEGLLSADDYQKEMDSH